MGLGPSGDITFQIMQGDGTRPVEYATDMQRAPAGTRRGNTDGVTVHAFVPQRAACAVKSQTTLSRNARRSSDSIHAHWKKKESRTNTMRSRDAS